MEDEDVWESEDRDREVGDGGCVDSVEEEGVYTEEGEWGMGGMLYMRLNIFILSAYVSC